jgi:hypothetical protein
MSPIVVTILLLAPASDPQLPHLVPPTRDALKDELEKYKTARSRLPMPPTGDGVAGRVNNGRFRSYYLPAELRDAGFGREADPAMTLDNTFKVKLFWIASRTNNCFY